VWHADNHKRRSERGKGNRPPLKRSGGKLKLVNIYLNQRRVGEVIVVDLKGRARFRGSTIELHKAVKTLLEEGRVQILLNLSGVSHMDSCGLGELLSCHVSTYKSGGSFKIAHLTEQLEELMEMTRLSTVFDIYDDEAKALATFAGPVVRLIEPQPFFM
jgi:anti-sigma B factor antagonist